MNMITHRVSPQAARYTPMGGREKCSFCRFYIAPKWCGHVTGPVSPMGWCKYFSQEMRAQFGGSQVVSAGGPALDLSFMSGALDPRITFTRASTATYTDASGTIQTAAINAPRWDYKAGVLQGLLIEEQRTNIQFPSVNWSTGQPANGSQDGITLNVGVSPTGANNAMAFIPGAFSGVHQFYGVPALPASTTYTYSVFCKAAGMNFVQLALENSGFAPQYGCFNLQAGTVDRQSANGSALIRAVGGGWYRCSVTATTTATPPSVNNIYPSAVGNQNGAFLSTGDNVNGIWVFGQQVEAGAFATSYIPTTAATVTRAQDDCTILPANMAWFTAPGGSWFAEFISLNPAVVAAYRRIISHPTPASIAPVIMGVNGEAGQHDGNAMFTVNTIMAGGVNKAATTWAAGPTARACLNGGAVATAVNVTAGFASLATSGVRMLANATAGDAISGWIRRVQYWPRVLADTEMQQVTS
jgi:hypothetical protein